MHTWCFTPTGSVLNYHGDGGNIWLDEPNRNYTDRHSHLLSDKTRGVSSYMANTLTPSFAIDPDEDEYNNTAHTWFTSQSSSYLIFNLIGANELDGIEEINYGATFNYGRADLTPETDYFGLSLPVRTSSILDHSLVVNNSEFNVNENNLIGLTPSPYAPENLGNSSANSHFVMFLGPICNPLPKVTLELKANAEMKIGDGDSRTGTGLVQDGHEIVVNTDGKIRIKQGSTLKINSGGTLKIEDGGIIIIEDGASLIVEEGGTIEYYEGGVVHLNGEDSRLIIDGLIHLNENAIFMPLHEGVNSGVVIVNSTTGALNGETGSAFRLIGDGNDDHMLTITEYGHLNSNADMSQLMLASCHVVFRSFEDYGIQSYSPFSSINVVYTVQFDLPWDATEPDFHPSIGLFNKSKIISSDFTDVILKCEDATESDEIFIRLNNSAFELTYLKEDIPILIKKGNLYM
jgi:hypothetical protein